MVFSDQTYSVLVVSASAKFNESVRGLLPERFYWPVTVLTDAAGARRELLENSYDLVVINTPLPDEFGTRLAQDICQHSAAGVAKKGIHSLLAQDLYKDLRTIQLHGVAPIPVPLLIHSLRESF